MDRGFQREPAAIVEISGGLVSRCARGLQYQQVAVKLLNLFLNTLNQCPANTMVLKIRVNRDPVDVVSPSRECVRAVTSKTSYNVIFQRNQEGIVACLTFCEVIIP